MRRLSLLTLVIVLLGIGSARQAEELFQADTRYQDAKIEIAVSPATKVCAELKSKGIVNVGCYGALCNGRNDDTDAMRAAVMAASVDDIVYIPYGTCKVSGTIDVTGTWITGAMFGTAHTTIEVDKDVEELLPAILWSQGRTRVENLVLKTNGKARAGLHVVNARQPLTVIRGVSSLGAKVSGFQFEEVQFACLERLTAGQNSEVGLRLLNSSGIRLRHLSTAANTGHGLVVQGDAKQGTSGAEGFPEGIDLAHVHSERNAGHGIVIKDVKRRSHLEYLHVTGSQHGIWLSGAQWVTLSASKVTAGAPGDAQNRAYLLNNETRDCVLEGNTGHADLTTEWGRGYSSVAIELGSTDNFLIGNTSGSSTEFRKLSVQMEDRNTSFAGGWFSYGQRPPDDASSWQPGDLIINTDKGAANILAWVCREKKAACSWDELLNN